MGVVFLITILVAAAMENWRWFNEKSRNDALTGWFCGVEADGLPHLFWFVLAAFVWFTTTPKQRRSSRQAFDNWCQAGRGQGSTGANGKIDAGAALASLGVAILAFWMSWRIIDSQVGLPPGYHDEYSYLFQTETFAAGRLSFPSFEPHPEIFDQVHVLNEGRFASRYFPGVGVWLLPFYKAGNPWLAGAAAFAMVAFSIFWIGRELSGNGVGLLAGVLTALSPGIILFSTTLLAHLPTLAALSLFLLAMLLGMRKKSQRWFMMAGCCLTAAMLCRPMTAAGFALPFGVWFAFWWVTGKEDQSNASASSFMKRSIFVLSLGGPLLVGFGIMACYNRAITGKYDLSPYQLYTDLYTPRHVYGFNNVVKGEQKLGPKVLENYDRWAENLTPQLAVKNVWRRLVHSLRGTLGIVTICLGGFAWLLFPKVDRRWWLILASILSLHAAHIPYWFEGIMGWHYVFESAPLWLLITASGLSSLNRGLMSLGRGAVRLCLWGGVLTAVIVNHVTVPPLWPGQLPRRLVEVEYPRRKYAAFQESLEAATAGRRAIVFILPDSADRHMDYVTNDPQLSGTILRARVKSKDQALELSARFPRREPWFYDASTNRLDPLPGALPAD